jgi:pimeloyl-ACP methyl ester carboxylesterase
MRCSARFGIGIVGLAALLAGGALVASWAPDRPVAELAQRWAQPPSQFLEIAGVQAHVRDEGRRDDPMPVVLLHGTSASLHTWDGWVTLLSPERRLVRVDLPGFGLTGPAADGDYRIERYVEFVTQLLDALGIERCVLAGNSFGGWVAWETALALPDRVGALVLVDSAGYPLESQSVPLGFRLAQMPLLSGLMESVLPRSVIESSLRNTYGDPARVTPALVDRYFELTLRAGNRAALAQRFAAGRHAQSPARVRDLRVPTLILWGGRDRLIPPQFAQRFHDDIAGSRLVTFPDLGHVPHEEDPRATAAAALAFLRGIDQSTEGNVAASTSPRAP